MLKIDNFVSLITVVHINDSSLQLFHDEKPDFPIFWAYHVNIFSRSFELAFDITFLFCLEHLYSLLRVFSIHCLWCNISVSVVILVGLFDRQMRCFSSCHRASRQCQCRFDLLLSHVLVLDTSFHLKELPPNCTALPASSMLRTKLQLFFSSSYVWNESHIVWQFLPLRSVPAKRSELTLNPFKAFIVWMPFTSTFCPAESIRRHTFRQHLLHLPSTASF